MSQTLASRDALVRCDNLCEWHLARLDRMVDVHFVFPGYHFMLGGAHHILGRAKVDDIRAILGLCGKCHGDHHNGKSPTKQELAELMLEKYGFNLWELWPQFIKPRKNDNQISPELEIADRLDETSRS